MYQTRSGVATLPLIECTSRRHDCWVLRYGCQKEADTEERTGESYVYWAHDFGHKPTLAEIKEVIYEHINAETDAKILSGFEWQGIGVWLSEENQRNFSEAQRIAASMPEAILPVVFKLGEDEDGQPVYHEFTSSEELTAFYMAAVAYINRCLAEGWQRKDSFDWTPYLTALNVER